ncbi:hypothetical protein GXP67_35435 [Rhodocytophaga rosea]|uniref:Cadherin repeat domain-containing protein n=1 Tax=Rhodocytophaga rosea TaxID=2704465 RepID=A0A6C0GU70_9BACT|nr:hypothetical protein [Rhodocytophaga rosea]QHT71586.1 hypothetical protein GXP67_35435 [Rhodocytophaga rosea]
MKKRALFSLFFAGLFQLPVSAQDSTNVQSVQSVPPAIPVEIILPTHINWNYIPEGQKLEFDLKTNQADASDFTFSLKEGALDGMVLDSTGHFSWTPGFDFVDRLHPSRNAQLVFEAHNDFDEKATKVIELKVVHMNQAPVVEELKPFYVQYNVSNTYTIDKAAVRDEDEDPLVFIPISDAMPEGAKLSSQGEFIWKPSLTQFNQLKSKPLSLEFYVEDQPGKSRTKGKFRIEATSMDLAPEVSIVPKTAAIRYKEDATVNMKFYLMDPNGDSDISSFGFVSENTLVPKSALVQNTINQYEFIWTPGYDFVQDPVDSVTFSINFFVIDKTQKRDEKKVQVTILNAVNEGEKDNKLYTDYRTSLVRAWDLMEQLKDTEKDLKKKYNRAKKGKKGRSITNASLGAVSGLAPVVLQPSPTQKIVSTVGGTTVMTIGTLEATEVIGRSTKDLIERLNYIMEKKNELQTKGDIFARKYSLKSSRRKPEFIKEMDEFVAVMNLKGLVALELDAGWQNKTKASDAQLVRTFKDFVPEN